MPAFTDDTPRDGVTVLEIPDLTLPRVYVTGHALTEDEAKFMNLRLQGIINNAYSGDIRRETARIDSERRSAHAKGEYKGPMQTHTDDGKPLATPVPAKATWRDVRDEDGNEWDHQANLDEKFAAYKVGGLNTRQAIEKDPVERVAREIAVRETKEALGKQGHKVKTWMDTKNEEHGSEFNKLVHARLNGKHKDRIYALAKAQLDSRPEEDDDIVVPENLQEAQEAA